MKKNLILFLCLLCLTGCSSTSSNIDIQTLDSELSQKITFEDELTLYEGNVQNLYGIEEPKSSIVYVGSGATAEELAFFEFEDTTTANEAYEQLEYYIKERKESYAIYNPKEAERLENAIIKIKDCVVLLCVSNDENALEKINEYL